ncbi:hypothetical protein BU26DRAFT_501968 [Trematosphaeria pertusa]|uniref:Uncharacterized protein n=1 Tax=Trematosphaeria pertusa TaxID=390896 RepID=A0A6A6IUF6_9PLEO|nr:uncharacterized protein BU26DRAFT_501968 [Trematosphaeria pertusa]KAF2253848.1 hypothetical protein BU26DRAFT_501968 [Trematosphaeria pertusa]
MSDPVSLTNKRCRRLDALDALDPADTGGTRRPGGGGRFCRPWVRDEPPLARAPGAISYRLPKIFWSGAKAISTLASGIPIPPSLIAAVSVLEPYLVNSSTAPVSAHQKPATYSSILDLRRLGLLELNAARASSSCWLDRYVPVDARDPDQ